MKDSEKGKIYWLVLDIKEGRPDIDTLLHQLFFEFSDTLRGEFLAEVEKDPDLKLRLKKIRDLVESSLENNGEDFQFSAYDVSGRSVEERLAKKIKVLVLLHEKLVEIVGEKPKKEEKIEVKPPVMTSDLQDQIIEKAKKIKTMRLEAKQNQEKIKSLEKKIKSLEEEISRVSKLGGAAEHDEAKWQVLKTLHSLPDQTQQSFSKQMQNLSEGDLKKAWNSLMAFKEDKLLYIDMEGERQSQALFERFLQDTQERRAQIVEKIKESRYKDLKPRSRYLEVKELLKKQLGVEDDEKILAAGREDNLHVKEVEKKLVRGYNKKITDDQELEKVRQDFYSLSVGQREKIRSGSSQKALEFFIPPAEAPEKIVSAPDPKKSYVVEHLYTSKKRDFGEGETREEFVDLGDSQLGAIISGGLLDDEMIENVSEDFKIVLDSQMQDDGIPSLKTKIKEERKAQEIEKYNEQNIREMAGLLPASAFPEQQKIEKSGQQEMEASIKEARSVLGMKYLKKGGNPIYLKTMKALQGFYKNRGWKKDRLDAIIFREEYVLPTINGLIESNKKVDAKMVLDSQMQEAFGELVQERRKKVAIGHGFIEDLSGVKIKGTIKTRNQLLKSFGEVVKEAGDQQLAASCKWAARSLASKAKRIGKSMVGIKPKKRDKKRLSEVSRNSGQGFGMQ